MNVVVVATISETFPAHYSELSLRCFSTPEKAAQWIEGQIDEKVKEYGLDRDTAVDGCLVLIDGWNHTIQYGFEVLDVE